jgi:parallel beta-helix repeat protein
MMQLTFLLAVFLATGQVNEKAPAEWPQERQQAVAAKLLVPDDAARAKALEIAKQVFDEDYKDRKADARRALVRKLLKQADDPANDAAMQYVLLTEAARIAAEVGDADTALDSAARKASRFEDDPLRLKLDVLSVASRAIAGPDGQTSLAEKWTSLADEAVSAESFDVAEKAAASAVSAAHKTKNKELTLRTFQEQQRIKATARLFAATVNGGKTLKANPDDPEANSALGRYKCFVKGQWDDGLAHLTKVDATDLKAAAEADIAAPKDANDQAALGDMWYQLAKQEKDVLGKTSLQARARHWYTLALPKLAGMDRAKVEGHLALVAGPKEAGLQAGKDAEAIIVPSNDEKDRPPRAAPSSLSGVQQVALLQLRPTTRPHRLTGKYVVPQGKRLEIEAGAIIECEVGSELSISGEIAACGTANNHVVMRARRGNLAGWAGVNIDHTDSARFESTDIHDAVAGITMVKSRCTLRGCILSSNGVGLKVTNYGSGSNVVLEDCVIAFNKSDGICLLGSNATIRESTITNNGGWGIRGEYYASPEIHQTVITLNKGGINCKHYECKLSADGSILAGNAGLDIKNESSVEWDLRGNFWGKELTKVLRTRGPTTTLPNIAGRARLDGFLDNIPKQCGASVRTLDKRKLW